MPLLAPCLSIALFLGAGPTSSRSPALIRPRAVGASSSLAQKTRVVQCVGGKPHWRNATFGPASAMDGSPWTAWCEGVPGPGIGEWLEFQIDDPVESVLIRNGFQNGSTESIDCSAEEETESDPSFKRGLGNYRSNGRPAVLELTTVEGKMLERFQLADVMTNDYIFDVRLQPGKYRLRIAQVYPGTRFEDTCIADLHFYGPRKEPVPEVFGALAPFAHRWSCRADGKTMSLPEEVRFLGMTGEITAHDLATHRGAVNIEVGVRTPAGALLPGIWMGCFWGGSIDGIECLAASNEAEESLDRAELVKPAWSVNLKNHEPSDVASPWIGELAFGRGLASGDTGDLQLKMAMGPGPGPRPVDLSVSRAGAPVEKAQYRCTQLP